jgi:hypothetical protein
MSGSEREGTSTALSREERIAALEWRCAVLVSALENWGDHHAWCDWKQAPGVAELRCNCGYFDAMRGDSRDELVDELQQDARRLSADRDAILEVIDDTLMAMREPMTLDDARRARYALTHYVVSRAVQLARPTPDGAHSDVR